MITVELTEFEARTLLASHELATGVLDAINAAPLEPPGESTRDIAAQKLAAALERQERVAA